MNVHGQTRFITNSLATICLILLLTTTQVKMQDEKILKAPAVTEPLYRFTSHLLTTLNDGTKSESQNIIVSPISIHKALNMVLLGTNANSTTKRELLDAIGYSGLSDAEVQKCHEDYARVLAKFKQLTTNALEAKKQERRVGEDEDDYRMRMRHDQMYMPPVLDMFNMVITHNKAEVLPEYRTNVKKYYESSVENVDDKKPETKTKIAEHLNKWGKEAGFEQPIMSIDELGGDYVAILLSAIRVEASWRDNFYESKDEKMFYNHGHKDKPVIGTKLILSKSTNLKYLELTDLFLAKDKRLNAELRKSSDVFRQLCDLHVQIVQVPLDEGLSYTIFEPLDHSTPGDNKLDELINKLFAQSNSTHEAKLSKALQLLESDGDVDEVTLTMPKFKFEKELSLKKVLQSMGIRKAFDDVNAEIYHMTKDPLYISDAKHQAMIEVNEKGIKAAGVTKVQMMFLSAYVMKKEPLQVSIEKPFVYMIRYGEIPLFVGQLSSL